jgi:hypothetical protein
MFLTSRAVHDGIAKSFGEMRRMGESARAGTLIAL